MLILSRYIGETFIVGDGIAVTVVATRGGQVRLAVDAPRDVPILRSELIATPETNARPSAPVIRVKPHRRYEKTQAEGQDQATLSERRSITPEGPLSLRDITSSWVGEPGDTLGDALPFDIRFAEDEPQS